MPRVHFLLLALLGAALGCQPSPAGSLDDGPPQSGADPAADAGALGEGVVDAGGGATPDAGEGIDAEPEDPPAFVRFVVLGDAGKGNEGQYLVAAAMKAVCDERGGCDFGVMLGDNIYNVGVDGTDDPQWQEKFELPYADIDFAFYSTLGNHDYGAPAELELLGGIGLSPSAGEVQVEYTGVSEKFFMPDTHYRVFEDPVELVSLNTTSLFWADLSFVEELTGFDEENDRLVENMTAWNDEAAGPWRIAFGHHPFLSNGPHGNAGVYDNVIIDGLVGSGTALKAFFEDYVLGQYDVFLAGHDHSLQDQGEVSGTQLFVSGGGATHTGLDGDNLAVWQAARRGFLLIEASLEEMTFTFVVVPDAEDSVEEPFFIAHTRSITR